MGGHGEGARDEQEVEVLGGVLGERVAAHLVEAVVVGADDGVVEGLCEGVAGRGAEDGVAAVGTGDGWVGGAEGGEGRAAVVAERGVQSASGGDGGAFAEDGSGWWQGTEGEEAQLEGCRC